MKYSEIAYVRPDMDVMKMEMATLLTTFKGAGSAAQQIEAMNQINDKRNWFETNYRLSDINYSKDTTNPSFQEEKAYFDRVEPEFKALVNDYYNALISSPFRDKLEEQFGKQMFRMAELEAKTISSEIIEDLGRENELSSQYMKLKASAKINFDEKELNLAGLAPYMQSPDRQLRKNAVQAQNDFFAGNGEEFDRIYDEMVKLRNGMAKKQGFNNFVEMGYARMWRSDYNAKDAANYRQQIVDEVVPLVSELRKDQKARLGVEELFHHDVPVLFSDGNPTPKGDPDWIVEQASQMYKELSPETDAFFQHMKDTDMMDLVNRKGKAGGGFCDFLPGASSPFIFSNFNGTSHDVTVLTHEAGHAFQVYQSRHFSVPEYYWPTFEAAEIHSMAMEFITWPWMGNFFKEDLDKFLYEHLAGLLFFLPYGVQVDEFQHYVYENPQATPAERKAHWMELDRKYQPHLQFDGYEYLANGGYWQRQAHIYQSPFYYIDYTLAGVCAMQFWLKATEDPKGAWEDYMRLCKAGGSMSFLELVDLAGLRSPFEPGCLKEVVDHARKWLAEVEMPA